MGFAPEALRRLRRARGLTLDMLGERAGATRASLIAFEKGGRRPGLHTLRSLAAVLECELTDLVPPRGGPPSFADLRMRFGLTRTELAVRLGLGRPTWDQIERGTRALTMSRVAEVARCLGVEEEVVIAAAAAAVRPGTAGHARPAPPPGPPGRLELRPGLDAFVGREVQLAELGRLLSQWRLITLTGTAGVGKTRLALEVSRRSAADRADGACLVELAATRDPGLVPQAVAAALGVRERRETSLAGTLRSRLRDARLLLVLDNCEHVVGACAELIGGLLSGCPGVTFLATSQRPLGVAGERVWPVPALGLPGAGAPRLAIESSEAVRLFCGIASAGQRGFGLGDQVAPTVAEICRRLEGIPLAIQLAAARTSVLTPAEILRRLERPLSLLTGGGGGDRSRTLRGALDWSYGLLPAAERWLLRQLSIFAGGCDVEAVEAVCDADATGDTTLLDSLAGLVTKSLVIADTSGERARYRLLESIREYAAERAEETGGTAALRTRHLRWCIDLAETAEVRLTGPEQVTWVERLQTEHDNLRAALRWAVAAGDAEAGLRLAGALTLFWRVHGDFREGHAWCAAALGIPGGASPQHVARALHGMGFLALMVQDTASAVPALERALELSRASGDIIGQARSLLVLGNARAMTDAAAPLALFEESAALAREAGDRWCLGHALAMRARCLLHTGDTQAARSLLEEGVHGAREAGELQSLRMGLYLLATVARREGDPTEAESLLQEGLGVTRQLGEPFDTAVALQSLGELAGVRGDQRAAEELLREALVLARRTGDPGVTRRVLSTLGVIALRNDDVVGATSLLEEAAATAAMAGLQPDASTQEGLGELAAAGGDAAGAARLLEEALAVARAQGDRTTAARSLASLAELSHRRGHRRRAAELHREALALRGELADRPALAESLDALSRLAAEAGRWEEAARLLGAAQSMHDRGRFPRPPSRQAAHSELRRAIAEALGRRGFTAAWQQGLSMSPLDAVDHALRGGDPRRRAGTGWEILTPAERRIAGLVVQGLTNTQIAGRLHVTISTVEGHLSNVFGKLGLESRVQLVREGVRREMADDG